MPFGIPSEDFCGGFGITHDENNLAEEKRCANIKDKRYVLIKVDRREIKKPQFFDTYDNAHKEMKRQYEQSSAGGYGELNDEDAWCHMGMSEIDWKIFLV